MPTLFTSHPPNLVYHQLSVGHGQASVLRFPSGEVVLYDCGSLRATELVERTVAPWLWKKHIGSIDGVFISHPDIDHFNGVRELARRFPIAKVWTTEHFKNSNQPEAVELMRDLSRRQIPLEVVSAGDELRIGDAKLHVHWPMRGASFRDDNESSMVVEVTSAGRRLLLTGDLMGPAIDEIMSLVPGNFDVLIAPHHGARKNNPPAMVRWAHPKIVISSQRMRRSFSANELVMYRDVGSQIFRTDRDGTISVSIAPRDLFIETYLRGAFRLPNRTLVRP